MKQSAHDVEASYQDIKRRDPNTHLSVDRFERLEPVNLDYQQTVDALIAHGGNVTARDNQVLMWSLCISWTYADDSTQCCQFSFRLLPAVVRVLQLLHIDCSCALLQLTPFLFGTPDCRVWHLTMQEWYAAGTDTPPLRCKRQQSGNGQNLTILWCGHQCQNSYGTRCLVQGASFGVLTRLLDRVAKHYGRMPFQQIFEHTVNVCKHCTCTSAALLLCVRSIAALGMGSSLLGSQRSVQDVHMFTGKRACMGVF